MRFMTSNQMDLPKETAFCSSAACGNAKTSKPHTKDKDKKHDRLPNKQCNISKHRTVLQEIKKQTAIEHKVRDRVNPWGGATL